MKVPARVKSAFRSRNVLHFFVSFLLLQNTHIKRVVARSHREVCVSSKARRSCSISPRGVFRVVERAFKKRLRQREREREREPSSRGDEYFRTQQKNTLEKHESENRSWCRRKPRFARPRRVALLLERRGRQRNSGRIREGAIRAEENVYDGEAAFKAAAALTEAKGEAEKNERRNGARQTAERDAREKFGTERTIGSNAAEYAKRSAIESISSTCSERPPSHRGKRKRAYERGASSVAYRNGQTGETSQVVTACTNARSATRREVESGKGQGEKTPGDIKFKYHVVAPTTAAISTTHRYVGANEYDHGEHNFKHFKSGV